MSSGSADAAYGKMIGTFLRAGLDPNHRFDDGLHSTLLHKTVESNQIDVVGALLDSNANTAAKDNSGQTALARARQLGHREVTELLSQAERLQNLHDAPAPDAETGVDDAMSFKTAMS